MERLLIGVILISTLVVSGCHVSGSRRIVLLRHDLTSSDLDYFRGKMNEDDRPTDLGTSVIPGFFPLIVRSYVSWARPGAMAGDREAVHVNAQYDEGLLVGVLSRHLSSRWGADGSLESTSTVMRVLFGALLQSKSGYTVGTNGKKASAWALDILFGFIGLGCEDGRWSGSLLWVSVG